MKTAFHSLVLILMASSGLSFGQTLRSAAEPDYPPFSIVRTDGRADGFAVELLQAALSEMNRKATFKTAPWSQIKTELAQGELDVLPLVGRTPEREALFDFTVPYLTLHGALFVRDDAADIQSLADLPGKTIAVMKGDNAEEYVLRAKLSDQIISTATFEDAFNMLSEGKADAVIAQKLMGVSLLKELDIQNVKVVGRPNEEFKQDFCFAVKKGNAELLALLNEGQAIVNAKGSYQQLYQKWLGSIKYESETSRALLYAGGHAYPPFEFLDEDGRPAGFNIDLMKALSKELGMEVSFQLLRRSEVRQKIIDNELDLTSMLYSKRRDREVDFSAPLLASALAVFARNDSPPYQKLEDLKTYRVSVQDGDLAHDFALEQGLGENLVVTASPQEALQLLADGTVDFSLSGLMQEQYWINQYGWKNLHVVEPRLLVTDYCYAVPEGREDLLNLINAGLTQLKQSGEYRRIYNEWLGPLDSSINWEKIRNRILVVVAGLALAGLLVVLWIYLLQRQVRKKTAELRESESCFHGLFEHMLAGCVIYDAVNDGEDFEIRHINQIAEGYVRWSRDEVIGRLVSEAFPGVVEMGLLDQIRRVWRTGTPESHPGANYKDDRLDEWIENHIFKLPSGQVAAIYFLITERLKTERKLLESEERFQLLFTSTPTGIAIYQPVEQGNDFVFVDMNPAGMRFTETPIEQLIGSKVSEVFPGVKESGVFDGLQRVEQTGKPERIPVTEYKDDRIELWVENHIFRLPSGLIVAVFEDITEQHQAEERLRSSEEKLRRIIENSTNMFYSHTPDHVLTYVSPQVKNILGYEVEEALVHWTKLAVDTPASEHALQLTEEAIRTGKAQSTYELQLIHKDGHPVWVEVREAPIVEDGKTVAIVGSLNDITDRMKAEEELQQKMDELERFNKAMVGRELRMVELKKEVNRLCRELGREPPYPLQSLSDE